MNPKEVRMYIVVNSGKIPSDLIRIIGQTVARKIVALEQMGPMGSPQAEVETEESSLYREWKHNLYPKIVTEVNHKLFSLLTDPTIFIDPSGSVAVFSPLRYENRPPILKRAKLLRDTQLHLNLGLRPERGRYVMHLDFNQDVQMSVGKLSAQVAHSVGKMIEYMVQGDLWTLGEWIRGGYALMLNGLPSSDLHLMTNVPKCVWTEDAGRTEIPSGTLTTVAHFPQNFS